MLKSLTTLNQILADAHSSCDLGTTWAQSTVHNKPLLENQHITQTQLNNVTQTLSKQHKHGAGLSAKHDPSTNPPPLGTTITIRAKAASGDGEASTLHPKFDNLELESFISEDMRATTPVGVSTVEPCFSRVARSVSAPCEAGEGVRGVGGESVRSDGVTEMEALNESTVESRRQLTVAEEK